MYPQVVQLETRRRLLLEELALKRERGGAVRRQRVALVRAVWRRRGSPELAAAAPPSA